MVKSPDSSPRPGLGGGGSKFAISVWVVLFGLWVVLSGKLDLFHLSVGVITVAAVAWQQYLLQPMRKAGEPRLGFLPVLFYLPWLLWQMILSSLFVARLILRDRDQVDPQVLVFRSDQPSVVHHVILANSITLTPGTLTVDLQGDRYLVHALSGQTAMELLEGTMARKVARLSQSESDGRIEPPPHDSLKVE
jgi:multicomponent Na+:H+ antiporter subunit E